MLSPGKYKELNTAAAAAHMQADQNQGILDPNPKTDH